MPLDPVRSTPGPYFVTATPYNYDDHPFEQIIMAVSDIFTVLLFIVEAIKVPFFAWLIAMIIKRHPLFSNLFYTTTVWMWLVLDVPIVVLDIVYTYIYPESDTLLFVMSVTVWYTDALAVFMTLLIMMNRFTAIVFWQHYKRIWQTRNICLLAPFVFGFPFILYSYLLINYTPCLWLGWDEECFDDDATSDADHPAVYASNYYDAASITFAVITVILGVIVFSKKHNLSRKSNSQGANLRLFAILVINSSLKLIYAILQHLRAMFLLELFYSYSMGVKYCIVFICIVLIHVPSALAFTFLLPIMEKEARRSMLVFYRIRKEENTIVTTSLEVS